MLLKLRACLLSLPLLVVNAERSQVMHSSGRRRREARLSQQALANIEQVLAKTDLQEHDSIFFGGGCEELNAGCWTDGDCCGEMECLGIIPSNWACGNSPGRVDEYCNMLYTCDSGLACHDGLCADPADICGKLHAGCLTDGGCCGEMECLGINPFNAECGNTPGHVDEYCDIYYACDSDLACFEGLCTEYADILDRGNYEGTCNVGSPSGQLTVMTYNTFLISAISDRIPFCSTFSRHCQTSEENKERIGRLTEWAKTRDEDVIVFQELYSHREKVIEGMVAAGFCHYVVTPYGSDGDGTATFSKHPIGEVDFWDYYDFMQNPFEVPLQNEVIFMDRGIMYTEVLKDGRSNHIYNTHTLSNTENEEHERRMDQYQLIREKAVGKSASDLVLFAGDLNENKYHGDSYRSEYYLDMLGELNATEPGMRGEKPSSYNNELNPLPATAGYLHEDREYKELLDYVLISNEHLQPSYSLCKILQPQWPEDCNGVHGKLMPSGVEQMPLECAISDHFPVTCRYSFDDSYVAVE